MIKKFVSRKGSFRFATKVDDEKKVVTVRLLKSYHDLSKLNLGYPIVDMVEKSKELIAEAYYNPADVEEGTEFSVSFGINLAQNRVLKNFKGLIKNLYKRELNGNLHRVDEALTQTKNKMMDVVSSNTKA